MASMVVTWWIAGFLCGDYSNQTSSTTFRLIFPWRVIKQFNQVGHCIVNNPIGRACLHRKSLMAVWSNCGTKCSVMNQQSWV